MPPITPSAEWKDGWLKVSFNNQDHFLPDNLHWSILEAWRLDPDIPHTWREIVDRWIDEVVEKFPGNSRGTVNKNAIPLPNRTRPATRAEEREAIREPDGHP